MSNENDPIDEFNPEETEDITPVSESTPAKFDPKIIVDTKDDTVRHQLRGMYQSWFLYYAS